MKRRALSLALFTAAGVIAFAPMAAASPLPNPDPGIPVPGVEGTTDNAAGAPEADGEIRVSAPGVGSEGAGSYVNPDDTVPNINGDPCTGGFESTVCYAEQMGDSPEAVQPRSEISASP